jgi:diguanylate cyclase (GGDEF)-like protein
MLGFQQPGEVPLTPDFRARSSFGVGLAGVLLLTPFTVNHLAQGRLMLAGGTGIIVVVMVAMAWVGSRGRYLPALVFFGFTPAVIVFLVLSLLEQGVIGALWCFPAVLAFYFTLPERHAWISNALLYVITVPWAWSLLEPSVSARVAATLLGVSVFSAIFVRVISLQQKALEEQAVKDALTGLHNRALLASTLDLAMEQSRRSGTPMTLLAFDLDDFKTINDTQGHAAGDDALRGLAGVIRSRIRRTDLAFRLGGEEFLAFLYGTDREKGLQVAEDLRAAVAAKPLIPDCPVTVSVGVATFNGDADWEGWLKRCDDNLYVAKAAGRNRVVG